jgi:L-malate glycosyltransferase
MDEGFGMALLEAMSQGKAIVASRVGGIPDLINGSNGMLVENDPQDIADAIEHLLLNKEAAMEMGERARECAIDRFGSPRTVTTYLSLYFPDDAHSGAPSALPQTDGGKE